jgi:hypothetical protein
MIPYVRSVRETSFWEWLISKCISTELFWDKLKYVGMGTPLYYQFEVFQAQIIFDRNEEEMLLIIGISIAYGRWG